MPDKKWDNWQRSQATLDAEIKPSARFLLNRRNAEALVALLSAEEVTLLRHITAGWSKAESAAHFGLDKDQFEARRTGLFAKLNSSSTTDAVRIGIYAGLD